MSSNRRSIFGSFKDKLSRKSSTMSDKSKESTGATASPGGFNSSNNPFAQPGTPADWPASKEAPPAYTPNPPATDAGAPPPVRDPSPSPSPSAVSGISASTAEDPYAFLASFDTVFLIDDSGSMRGRSWQEVQAALAHIVPVCAARDPDGLDVYFLNHRSGRREDPAAGRAAGGYAGLRTAAAVEDLFAAVRPGGGTPTGTRLDALLRAYMRLYEARLDAGGADADAGAGADADGVAAEALPRPVNIIVVTDGQPTDDPEAALAAHARRLDALGACPWQVGVQFFQVGSDAAAREALRALDDDIARLGVRDMVDTVTFDADGAGGAATLTADGIMKVVLGAVNRRLDRRQCASRRPAAGGGLLRPGWGF